LFPGIGGAKDGLRAADMENPEVLLVWLLMDARDGRDVNDGR
jgi:hypothetical protein